jgi:hypothetical protein
MRHYQPGILAPPVPPPVSESQAATNMRHPNMVQTIGRQVMAASVASVRARPGG